MTEKEIINAAIHNYLHDATEKETAVKYWLHDVVEKSEAFDENKIKAKAWDEMKRQLEDIADVPGVQNTLFSMSLVLKQVRDNGTHS